MVPTIVTLEQAREFLAGALPRPCPTCKGRGVVMQYPRDSYPCNKCDASGVLQSDETVANLATTVIAQADELDKLNLLLKIERKATAFLVQLADNIEKHNTNEMDDVICNQMLAECLSAVVTGDPDESADDIVAGLRNIIMSTTR